jgi:hypothetical protein
LAGFFLADAFEGISIKWRSRLFKATRVKLKSPQNSSLSALRPIGLKAPGNLAKILSGRLPLRIIFPEKISGRGDGTSRAGFFSAFIPFRVISLPIKRQWKTNATPSPARI